jgi:hypothetical protein
MITAREYLDRALATRRIACDMTDQPRLALDLLAIAWQYLELADAAPGADSIQSQISGARMMVKLAQERLREE